MKKIAYLSILVLVSFFTITLESEAQNIVTVTDCNLNGWIKQPIGNSSLGFVNGPSAPPIGTGSLKFNVPAGGIFWPGDFVRFRNGQYSGTPLSALTELSYSTFVEARDTIADIHFLVVLVDINGDGKAEHNLVFDPRYQKPPFIRSTMPDQGNTKEQVWQNWDALHGGWFFGGIEITDPDHEGPYFTMAEYMSLYPNAVIRNDAAKGGPAIRLSAGGIVFKPNFYGSIDDFRIGISGNTTIYDFEFSTANAGADKNVIYGYGSNCTTLNATAAGGVGPYSYAWSPGGSTPNQVSTEVCPSTTTTYTLTVTDAKGCIRTDDVTVFINDVRCGAKMEKVRMCHKGEEICVAKESVLAHLNHGDLLGSCNIESITAGKDQSKIFQSAEMKFANYPNPFNKITRLYYELPFDGEVLIKLYDVTGRELKTLVKEFKKAGNYSFELNAYNLGDGIFFSRISLQASDSYLTQNLKLVVIK